MAARASASALEAIRKIAACVAGAAAAIAASAIGAKTSIPAAYESCKSLLTACRQGWPDQKALSVLIHAGLRDIPLELGDQAAAMCLNRSSANA